MSSEIDFQMAAKYHQDELLTEAATRRLLRTSTERRDAPQPVTRRLQILIRRLADAPTFA